MDELRDHLPADLAALAEEFASAAAPFESDRGRNEDPGAHAEMLEIAGFLVGVVGLLLSLIGAYSAGTEARRKQVPDFEELLEGLLSGEVRPEEAVATLGRWKPDLSPVEVAEQWKSGNIARYEQVLGILGYPPQIVARILRESFGAIDELAQES